MLKQAKKHKICTHAHAHDGNCSANINMQDSTDNEECWTKESFLALKKWN